MSIILDGSTGITTPAESVTGTGVWSVGGTQIYKDASGNVGIGTSSPQNLLNIVKASNNASPASSAGVAIQSDSGATYSAGLHFGTDKANTVTYIQSDSSASYTAVPLAINPQGGNVGIGTSSPSYPLDVVGAQARISSSSLLGVRQSFNSTSTNGRLWQIGSNFTLGNGEFAIYDATASASRLLIDSSGNLLVGTTSQANGCKLSLQYGGTVSWGLGPSSGSNTFYVTNNSGTGVYLSTGATSWAAVSDERTKDIIEPITNAAEKVATLRAVIGKYKTDSDGVRRSFLIAQDVQAVLPEAVCVQDNEFQTLGVQYTDTIPLLVAAIQELATASQEQQAIISSQAEAITALTTRITALEQK